MSPSPQPDRSGVAVFLVFLVMAAVIAAAWGAAHPSPDRPTPARPAESDRPLFPEAVGQPSEPVVPAESSEVPETEAPETGAPETEVPETDPPVTPTTLPGGRRTVFGGNHVLVAYYGTAGTGALGVLGETGVERMERRLRRAARPFGAPTRPVQIVYELIVTVADASPGPDGDYSHDIPRADVRRYVAAAHRHGALLLLDVQPGRADFEDVAKRWAWALRYPNVGLALDPEWRMGRREVPGRVIGSVDAAEVNRVSAWLSDLTTARGLPEKLFVLHQFRTSMIERIGLVRDRPGLALVQHVDGFGTRSQKLATYAAVEQSPKFAMGFKLFYDEDVRRMGAPAVLAIRPRVRFVSFQ